MPRSPFYRSRTLAIYAAGAGLALQQLQALFPSGIGNSSGIAVFTLYGLPFFLFIGVILTFLDHMFASLRDVWKSVQDGVLGIVGPTAIALLLPSIYLQFWQGGYFAENQVLLSVQIISYWSLCAAVVLLLIALLGYVAGRLLFRL